MEGLMVVLPFLFILSFTNWSTIVLSDFRRFWATLRMPCQKC